MLVEINESILLVRGVAADIGTEKSVKKNPRITHGRCGDDVTIFTTRFIFFRANVD